MVDSNVTPWVEDAIANGVTVRVRYAVGVPGAGLGAPGTAPS